MIGRPNRGAITPNIIKWTLRNVRLDSGGYDAGGAYWGRGERLYWACCGDVERFFRAGGRRHAKTLIRREFPGARFYG